MSIYKEYVDLEKQIADLQEKREAMRTAILEEVKESPTPIKTEYGTFTKRVVTVWQYSDNLVNEETKLAEEMKAKKAEITDKKHWAQLHGQAKLLETGYQLAYIKPKVAKEI